MPVRFHVLRDSLQGQLTLDDPNRQTVSIANPTGEINRLAFSVPIMATLRPAADAGDQTVPVHSANSQYASGKFKGIFSQTGYEHQARYLDSIVQIARTMTWSKQ